MSEQPLEEIGHHVEMLQSWLKGVEEKIASAKTLLAIVEAGHGDLYGGYEWKEMNASGKRMTLLHVAKSASLEYGHAINALKSAMPGMSPEAVESTEARLAGYQTEINVLAERLFTESEKYQ